MPRLMAVYGAFVAMTAFAQTKSLTQGAHRMELTLERQTRNAWVVVDPGYVFAKGEVLRFRFKTNFAGYLYVMNQGTSGTYTRLFPREDTGLANRVEPDTEYVVPAGEGAFRVDGPPGFDLMYWVMTPVEMGSGEHNYKPLPPPPPPSPKTRASLRPRCDDSIFRARGECVDASAGAQAVTAQNQLPKNLSSVPTEQSKDLVFMKEQKQSVVSSAVPLAGPVVYEFRLAHR